MREIHIINPFSTASGGSERRAIALGLLLRPYADVTWWATSDPAPALAAEIPIRTINPLRMRFPRRGTFIFVGVYYWLTSWIKLARPSRRIIIFNTMKLSDLHGFRSRVARGDTARCEIVYAASEAQALAGLPGTVHESPIDIYRFVPVTVPERPFTVGRLSRDTIYKFHPADPEFLELLARSGCRVRVMGGTCLAGQGKLENVELLPACAVDAATFLQQLDCFFFRTDPSWLEAFGRVVFEAMACGVVPVCEARGGYARFIKSGENGFLFTSQTEAAAQIRSLRENPALRARMAVAARHTVERMYDHAFDNAMRSFYLSAILVPPETLGDGTALKARLGEMAPPPPPHTPPFITTEPN